MRQIWMIIFKLCHPLCLYVSKLARNYFLVPLFVWQMSECSLHELASKNLKLFASLSLSLLNS